MAIDNNTTDPIIKALLDSQAKPVGPNQTETETLCKSNSWWSLGAIAFVFGFVYLMPKLFGNK
jgi:hypothetical protein